MKNTLAIAAILLASLAAASSASAQDHAAKANVPFDFYVGNQWVPAGTYTLTSDSGRPEVIAIRSGDSKIALLTMGLPEDRQPGSHSLVFKKYGNQYFLHEIQCAGSGLSVAFSDSKREKYVRTREEASLAAPATVVYLALN